jgi:PKD repeat protein
MINARHDLRRLGPALVLTAALALGGLLSSVSGARAETYGELAHFGAAGTGVGQFRLVGSPTMGTHALGVDPTDNSVYVGDEPLKREYRIQKFTVGGHFQAATALLKPANRDGLEGIAVDPAEKRIYVLALERRSESASIDSTKPAAGTLYAFSTEQSGEVLEPAPGTDEGVLVGPSAFEADSEALGRALLNPRGIAVDPSTHDVIVLGEVDEGVLKAGESPRLHVALQRVHSNGSLGPRYLDNSGYFPEEESPNSPIVTPNGSVYVAQTDDVLAQIPTNFASSAPPTPFLQFTPKGLLEADAVAEFDVGEAPGEGGGLALAPPSAQESEGTIYAEGHIFDSAAGNAFYPGVLAFAAGAGTELGWTGGQSKQSGGESCTIGFGGPTYPSLAAGSGHMVFVLDPKTARVLEFGPEGTGCPVAEATAPQASVGGTTLASGETVSPGTPVTFSSTIKQANAVSVEWDFGDGTTKLESADEYQRTEVTHEFAHGGDLTVKETIHTDDLATPTIVKEIAISVSSTAVAPTAVLEGPLELTLGASAPERLVYLEGGGLGLESAGGGGAVGASADFDGSASFDPNPPGSDRIVSYHWDFGDGESQTTETTTVSHVYDAPGAYKVQLTVTDALGMTSQPSALTLKVNAPSPSLVIEAVHPPVSPPPVVSSPTSPPSPATTAAKPSPRLAGTALVASSSGVVRLVVTCPGVASCAGTVTLRGKVASARSRHTRKAGGPAAKVITLATGAFTIGAGRQQTLTLRLNAEGRALLARSRRLSLTATIAVHGPTGASVTSQQSVALRSARHVKKLITHGR